VVTNNLEDTVSFFDLEKAGAASFPEWVRLPLGLNPVEVEAPHHAAFGPQGKYWYTVLSYYAPGTGSGPHGTHGTGIVDGQVLKISTEDHRVVATARVDRNPGDLLLSPDGKIVAVSHFDLMRITDSATGRAENPDARVALLNAETLERIAMVRTCPAPHGLQFSPDAKRLYVACYSDEVAIISMDGKDFPVARVKVAAEPGTAFTPRHQPYGLAFNPVSQDVFIACLVSREIRVLNSKTQEMDFARTLKLDGAPYFGAFSSDGTKLYVPTQGTANVFVIETASGQISQTIPLAAQQCINAHQAVFINSQLLAVVCEGNHVLPGSLVVLDAAMGNVKSVTPVGIFPDWVGVVRP
jgi:DNA-binding beta-propeller fold protein YncE